MYVRSLHVFCKRNLLLIFPQAAYLCKTEKQLKIQTQTRIGATRECSHHFRNMFTHSFNKHPLNSSCAGHSNKCWRYEGESDRHLPWKTRVQWGREARKHKPGASGTAETSARHRRPRFLPFYDSDFPVFVCLLYSWPIHRVTLGEKERKNRDESIDCWTQSTNICWMTRSVTVPGARDTKASKC